MLGDLHAIWWGYARIQGGAEHAASACIYYELIVRITLSSSKSDQFHELVFRLFVHQRKERFHDRNYLERSRRQDIVG
jgi:hypothetical protein